MGNKKWHDDFKVKVFLTNLTQHVDSEFQTRHFLCPSLTMSFKTRQ
jgi:hypothetical protein